MRTIEFGGSYEIDPISLAVCYSIPSPKSISLTLKNGIQSCTGLWVAVVVFSEEKRLYVCNISVKTNLKILF